jgi:hypothetical protein
MVDARQNLASEVCVLQVFVDFDPFVEVVEVVECFGEPVDLRESWLLLEQSWKWLDGITAPGEKPTLDFIVGGKASSLGREHGHFDGLIQPHGFAHEIGERLGGDVLVGELTGLGIVRNRLFEVRFQTGDEVRFLHNYGVKGWSLCAELAKFQN